MALRMLAVPYESRVLRVGVSRLEPRNLRR